MFEFGAGGASSISRPYRELGVDQGDVSTLTNFTSLLRKYANFFFFFKFLLWPISLYFTKFQDFDFIGRYQQL